MSRQPYVVRLNDPMFNPEKRCGRPRWTGGKTGKGVRLLETWFTSHIFRSWADEELVRRLIEAREVHPNTKHVLVERAKDVYYNVADGRFYEARRQRNPQRAGAYAGFQPVDGLIWTNRPEFLGKHGLPSAEIICNEGLPMVVHIGRDAFTVTNESWPVMEAFLGLDEQWKRNRKAA